MCLHWIRIEFPVMCWIPISTDCVTGKSSTARPKLWKRWAFGSLDRRRGRTWHSVWRSTAASNAFERELEVRRKAGVADTTLDVTDQLALIQDDPVKSWD